MASAGEVIQAGEVRAGRLESIRALAIFAALTNHVYLFSSGFKFDTSFMVRTVNAYSYSVFLLFAMSGYLLYLPFARRSFADGRSVDLKRYFRNRALRIL